MHLRKIIQDFLAPRRDLQADAPAVLRVACALKQVLFFAAIDQLDDCVVFQSQLFRCICDGNRSLRCSARNCQQQLMLLWMEARAMCRFFAGKQENPQLMAKFRERLVKRLVRISDCKGNSHTVTLYRVTT